ncbi:FAD-dependent oxidoreductase [Sphingomonas daechungensis]|uniref:FAD-dependent oxidoreductase n=1 Tax=Sphingomonas daechungensis TaxID=1176646 RepID=UPI001CB8EB7E|nr:NAD(P)/FAD-dependent oxidoreductase [Sphingomonas daechungensis]
MAWTRGLVRVGVHRSTLFDVLHDALVDEGIPILTGTTISGSRLETKGRRIIFESGGASEPYDLVIDALGTRSLLAEPCGRELAYGALWATLDWPHGAGFDLAALQQRYQRSKIMIGLLPIGIGRSGQSKAAFFWSLKCDQLDQWRAAGLDAWKADVRSLWWEMDPVLDQIIDAEQLTFARYSHRTLRRSAEPALIHLGDAWHSASPQLGQGANMAMLDAWSLARALERSANMDEALRVAVKMRRRHIQLYQWLTAIFTPVYQSDSRVLPFLRDRIVGPLSKIWPATWIQAAMVSGLIGNPLPGLGLDAGCRAP